MFSPSTRRYIIALLVTFILCLFFFNFIIGTAFVSGNSMMPTYHDGQFLIFNRHPTIERGSVAIIDADILGEIIIKRIIAVPGDTVEIHDGQVYVNGNLLCEPYISEDPYGEMERIIVPEETIFVMGDNRSHSTDSRILGSISIDKLLGIVPFSKK